MKTKITVGGDGADADLIICIKKTDPTPYTDNVHGVCSHCGVAIQWRPDVSAKAEKVCIECGREVIAGDVDGELVITATTAKEIADYVKKQRH